MSAEDSADAVLAAIRKVVSERLGDAGQGMDLAADIDTALARLRSPSAAIAEGYQGIGLTAEDLVERAVRNAGRPGDGTLPRWSWVGSTFALGSTSSTRLCRRFGLDPDEMMGVEPDEDEEPDDDDGESSRDSDPEADQP